MGKTHKAIYTTLCVWCFMVWLLLAWSPAQAREHKAAPDFRFIPVNLDYGPIRANARNGYCDIEKKHLNTEEAAIEAPAPQSQKEVLRRPTLLIASVLQWRNEIAQLADRLDTLRSSKASVGFWSKTYKSQNTVVDRNIEFSHQTYQFGLDELRQAWALGGTMSYADGSTSALDGSADTRTYTVGLYSSWSGSNGRFADFIGKFGRLENALSTSAGSAYLKNSAYSLSAKYGQSFSLAPRISLVPHGELSLGYIEGKDFRAESADVRIEPFESMVGRLGLRSEVEFPQKKGNFYVKGSLLHDWKGRLKGSAVAKDVKETFSEDLSETYYEVGVGARYQMSKNAHLVGALHYQTGVALKDPWSWNVGFTMKF